MVHQEATSNLGPRESGKESNRIYEFLTKTQVGIHKTINKFSSLSFFNDSFQLKIQYSSKVEVRERRYTTAPDYSINHSTLQESNHFKVWSSNSQKDLDV